jgi:branched-chain amino acid transport system substrate-binding protein
MTRWNKSYVSFAALIAGLCIASPTAYAQSNEAPIKIGELTDMSSAYSDLSGSLSVAAAQMAIDDFGGQVLNRKIQLIVADHQMKPSVGSALATEWLDRDGIDAIFGVPASSVAMAVQEIARNRPEKVVVYTIANTSDLSGKACAANTIQWSPDFYPLASTAAAYASKDGKESFLLVPDTAAGDSAQRAAAAGAEKAGGKLSGTVRVPQASGDVSSFVLQAQSTGASNLLIGFGGSDMSNVVKAANQFGLKDSGVSIYSLGLYSTDVDAMGLDLAQGIIFSTPFYPRMNAEAAAWVKRFHDKTGRFPAFSHVADYEAVTHYLRAVEKAGSTEASKVIPAMRELPVNSFAIKDGKIRADNHLVRPMYIGKIKPSSEAPDDYMELLETVSADQAYSSLDKSACPLAK